MSKLNIFIDGNNIFHSAKSENVNIDYSKLCNYIKQDRELIKTIFYTGVDDTSVNEDQKKFILWLKRNGFKVVTKSLNIDSTNSRKHVSYYPEMVTDMFFFKKNIDVIAIVGGSDALIHPIRRLSDSGIRIELYAFENSVSNKLLDEVDRYVLLNECKEFIGKA